MKCADLRAGGRWLLGLALAGSVWTANPAPILMAQEPAAPAAGAPKPAAPALTSESASEESSAAGAATAAISDLGELERRAEEAFAQDDLETAIAWYRQLADRQTEPRDKLRVLITIAWLELLLGRDSDSLTTLTGALVVLPDYPFQADLYSNEFRKLFYEAQSLAIAKRRELAENSIREGIEHLNRRDFAVAQQLFRQALTYLPDHPQALYNLALIHLYEDRHEEALAGFQKVLALERARPDAVPPKLRAQALNNLGYLYMARRLDQEAEEVLRQAVEIDPANRSAWTNLGAARRRLGQKLTAADAFRKAYQLEPQDPDVINNLALAYLDAENWVSAVGLLVEATQRLPANPRLWLNLGQAQLGLGNHEGAVQSFLTAMRNDPEDAKGFASAAAIQLSRHFFARGDHQRALEEAGRAVSWRPQLTDAWVYQGLAQQALGNLEAARTSFEEARRLDPTQAEVHNNLGSVYFDLGLLTEATEAFQRALTIDPKLSSAQSNLEAVRQVQSGERSAPRGTRTAASAAPPVAGLRIGWRFAAIDYSALGLKGVMLQEVLPDSLASRAGLRANDLILRADGREITNPADLERYIQTRPGQTIVLDLLRANLPQRVELLVK